MKGTGELLDQITLASLPRIDNNPVQLKSYEFLASYNWKDTNDTTILVPGAPARWTLPEFPLALKHDDTHHFIDRNASRAQLGGFDPFFKCLLVTRPKYDMSEVDLDFNRNSLRRLIDFCGDYIQREWRVEIDIVYNTMFLSRCEREHECVDNRKHYEKDIEANFLEFDNDMLVGTGQSRIIQYDFGGMRCLVRFGAHGYDEEFDELDGKDDLVADLRALGLETSMAVEVPVLATDHIPGEVEVIRQGHFVDPASILHLKHHASGDCNLDKAMAILYFSQTPRIYSVNRHGGVVEDEQVRKDVITKNGFDRWEQENQTLLGRLVELLKHVRKVARDNGGSKFVLVGKKGWRSRSQKVGHSISMYERGGKELFLPKGLREKKDRAVRTQ